MYLKISRKGMKRLGGRSDQHPCLAKLPLGRWTVRSAIPTPYGDREACTVTSFASRGSPECALGFVRGRRRETVL